MRYLLKTIKFLAIGVASIVAFVVGLYLLIVVGGSQIATTYQFGIAKDQYPDLFRRDSGLNNRRVHMHSNDYSRLTEIFAASDTGQRIRTEHMVRTNDFDVALLPDIDHDHHLISVIEFDQGGKLNIGVEHMYQGKALAPVANYIYRFAKETADGAKFAVRRHDSADVNEPDRFLYVRVYAFPERECEWSKSCWFDDSMEQDISITWADGGALAFHFKLKWVKTDSLAAQIMSGS